MTRWLVLSLAVACGGAPPAEVAESAPAAPERSPAVATAGTGKVLETMDSGGYTYARLDICGTESWIAGPQTPLAVGDVVATRGRMPMTDFHSSTLDRTFASILFVTAMTPTEAPVDCSQAAAAPPSAPPAPVAAAAPGSRQGKVLETMESGGYRYAHVDFCGTQAWVAGPAAPLEVGQTVAAGQGMPMRDFHSSTLDRTFASIDFVREMRAVQGDPACP